MNILTRETAATRLQSKLQALVRRAQTGEVSEQRAAPRYPFLQPVTISCGSEHISALSREISLEGIGVLHKVPLPTGRVILGIPTELGNAIQLRGEVVWRKTIGEGWHLSGIQFIDEVERP